MRGKGKKAVLIVAVVIVVLYILERSSCSYTLGFLMLSGCSGSSSEGSSKGNENKALASLEQAMVNYGVDKEAYEVTSVFADAYTARGNLVTKFQFKIGDIEYKAMVDDESGQVFTNYYENEFKSALEEYLRKEVDQSEALSGGTYELTAVWVPSKVGIYAVEQDGLVPAMLKPEDFEAFFAKYNEKAMPELELNVIVKYYSPEDNLNMNKMKELFQINARDNFYFRCWTCEFYKCKPVDAEESKLFAKYEYSSVQQKVTVEYVTSFGK